MRRHTSAAERDYVTLLFGIRGERKRLIRYLSQPSGLLVSMAAPHQAPCSISGRRESGRMAGLQKCSSPRRWGRARADSPSEALVVVDDFDAGVLLTDLSSDLWLQPAHMYGAATEQHSQAECPLNPTPLRLRDHIPPLSKLKNLHQRAEGPDHSPRVS